VKEPPGSRPWAGRGPLCVGPRLRSVRSNPAPQVGVAPDRRAISLPGSPRRPAGPDDDYSLRDGGSVAARSRCPAALVFPAERSNLRPQTARVAGTCGPGADEGERFTRFGTSSGPERGYAAARRAGALAGSTREVRPAAAAPTCYRCWLAKRRGRRPPRSARARGAPRAAGRHGREGRPGRVRTAPGVEKPS